MTPSKTLKTLKTPLTVFLTTLLLTTHLFSTTAKADNLNGGMMNLAIIGGISSLAFACYQGKDPCTLTPNLNTDKITLSTDFGSDASVQQARIAIGLDWQDPIYQSGSFSIDGRWEASAGAWNSTLSHPKNSSGWMIGITPIFNYNWDLGKTITPYFETGTGIQYLSNATIENEFKSTQFQFSDILGIGIKIGKKTEIGYRYLHISNANIELPNPGTDFHNLHIAYKF